MRSVIDMQMKIGEKSIASIQFDPQSRDEIPQVLRGLQAIFCNRKQRDLVFEALTEIIPPDINPKNGRKGMDLWVIFVLATVKQNCGWDYDKLLEIANNHKQLRQMFGHGSMDADYRYALQTLKDNISLLTPDALDKINQTVVNFGHEVVGKKKDEKLRCSCDSFVVKTNVHFPTDINILFDAIRVFICLLMQICGKEDIFDWCQGKYHIRKTKNLYRKIQRLKHSSSRDKNKQAERERLIIDAHLVYMELAQSLVDKALETLISIQSSNIFRLLRIEKVRGFIAHAERQIDQIRRRIVDGESIPHHEKVFSLFEQHTEWISKGKAGVPVELGLKVCIIKDQHQFILHHRVMQNETDDKIAVTMVIEAQKRFPDLNECSYDKGFHSPSNQEELPKHLDHVVLPRKGRLSAINQEIENSEEFKKARRKHSAVESSISALDNHGLDICRDHGIDAFKRHVAIAIVARNIQIIGQLLQKKEIKKLRRLEKSPKKAA